MLTIEGVYFYFGELSCRVLESVFTLTVWLHKDPGTRVFESWKFGFVKDPRLHELELRVLELFHFAFYHLCYFN